MTELRKTAFEISLLTGKEPSDVFTACAQIHATEIPTGFLSSLGQKFLTDMYKFIATNQSTVLMVARHENAVVGFISGSLNAKSILRGFIFGPGAKHIASVAIQALKAGKVFSVFETMRYMSKGSDDLPGAEILNFAVAKSGQGSGIGRKLFEAHCKLFAEKGVNQLRIVTGATQLSAIRFYESAGSVRYSEAEIHKGTQSIVFIHDIQERSDA